MRGGDRILVVLLNTRESDGSGWGGSALVTPPASFYFVSPTSIEIPHRTSAVLEALYVEATQLWAVLYYQSNFHNG